jgi:hypothetical protein
MVVTLVLAEAMLRAVAVVVLEAKTLEATSPGRFAAGEVLPVAVAVPRLPMLK